MKSKPFRPSFCARAVTISQSALAWPGGSTAFLMRCTRRSALVNVPSFSAQQVAGRTTSASFVVSVGRKARSVPVRPINVAEVGNLSNVRVASEQREILDDALKSANQRTYMRGDARKHSKCLLPCISSLIMRPLETTLLKTRQRGFRHTTSSARAQYARLTMPSRPNSVSSINSLLSCSSVTSTRTLRIFSPRLRRLVSSAV